MPQEHAIKMQRMQCSGLPNASDHGQVLRVRPAQDLLEIYAHKHLSTCRFTLVETVLRLIETDI